MADYRKCYLSVKADKNEIYRKRLVTLYNFLFTDDIYDSDIVVAVLDDNKLSSMQERDLDIARGMEIDYSVLSEGQLAHENPLDIQKESRIIEDNLEPELEM